MHSQLSAPNKAVWRGRCHWSHPCRGAIRHRPSCRDVITGLFRADSDSGSLPSHQATLTHPEGVGAKGVNGALRRPALEGRVDIIHDISGRAARDPARAGQPETETERGQFSSRYWWLLTAECSARLLKSIDWCAAAELHHRTWVVQRISLISNRSKK